MTTGARVRVARAYDQPNSTNRNRPLPSPPCAASRGGGRPPSSPPPNVWDISHAAVLVQAAAPGGGVLRQQAGLWPLYEPPEYQPYRLIDRARYEQGLPNMFDPDQAAPPRR